MHPNFKNKKITLMGLGLLGRGVGDAKFLAEKGADLIITDLKKTDELKESINKLKKYKNIKYSLGGHKLEDFQNRDLILKSAGVPFDSKYIAEAQKNKIPVKMSASLFAELSGATIVGITGTRGKSTVAHLVFQISEIGYQMSDRRVHLGGNIRDVANLPLLNKVKPGDIVVMELDSWQLQGFGEAKISPHVAAFTTFQDDHLNYYKNNRQKYFEDKAKIFKNQTENDYLITTKKTLEIIEKRYGNNINSKLFLASAIDIPKNWKINLPGEYNLENIALAIKIAEILKIKKPDIKKGVESFQPVSGRLEHVKTINNIKIYNDNNATTPDATIVALKSIDAKKKIVLIMGGSDKGLNMSKLIAEIKKQCKAVVLFDEAGTRRIEKDVFAIKNITVKKEDGLQNCVKQAIELSQPGDSILFSPAFASFGKYFKNEFERADQFIKLIKKL